MHFYYFQKILYGDDSSEGDGVGCNDIDGNDDNDATDYDDGDDGTYYG